MSDRPISGDPMLVIDDVSRWFRGNLAVQHVSFPVHDGEVVGLIGPNGAGKTTIFNCISGHLGVSGGRIRFAGIDVTRWPAHRRARAGIGRTFQIARPFVNLTVRQQVEVGVGVSNYRSLRCSLTLRPRHNAKVTSLIEDLGLAEFADRLAGTLPLVVQRRVEMARAEALAPKLMLLDEPGAGLADAELVELAERVRELAKRGRSVLLIEHSMDLAMSSCDRIVVLADGEVIADDNPDRIRRDKRVVAAYLGGEERRDR